MPRTLLLLVLAIVLASRARADCELQYAPPDIRARLLAFHYANELRRARELAHGPVARTHGKPTPDSGAARPVSDRAASARSPARAD